MRIDPAFVTHQIGLLLAEYPELSDDDALRADMIEGSTSAPEFLSMLVNLIGDTNSQVVAIDERKKELDRRQARFELRKEAYRVFVRRVMDAAELRKLELPEATLSIKAGPRAVVITNEAAIPQEFMRIKVEPDKAKIKQAINDGGFVLGAEMSNSQDVLQIRTT